jgi:hypothetical protein
VQLYSSSFRRLAVVVLLRAYVPAFAFFAVSFIPQYVNCFACDRARLGAQALNPALPILWSGSDTAGTPLVIAATLNHCFVHWQQTCATYCILLRSTVYANRCNCIFVHRLCIVAHTYVCRIVMTLMDVFISPPYTMQGTYKMQHNIHVTGYVYLECRTM